MNKYVIAGIIIGTAILIAGLALLGQPSTNQTNPAHSSALKSNENLFDFGTISMARGKVSHQFQITNTSNKPITITKMFTSCMCTSARLLVGQKIFGPFGMEGMGGNLYLTQTFNPGETGTVEVIFDPAAHGPAGLGLMDRFAYLDDTDGGQLQVEIKSTVTP